MTEWKVSNCPKCGGPLKSMSEDIKFCPYCGVELEKVLPEGKFTLNINKNIKKEITNTKVIRDEAAIAESKSMNIFWIAWVIFMILAFSALLLVYFFG